MIRLTNILYLANFARSADVAVPVLRTLHRGYGAKVHVLHVILSEPGATVDETEVQHQAERLSSLLNDIHHEVLLERAEYLWQVVEPVIQDRKINLLVLGRRDGRRSDETSLASSVGEVYERSLTPVLTLGSGSTAGFDAQWNLRRILLATDFTPDATNALAYALELSKTYGAKLILLHVVSQPEPGTQCGSSNMSVAEVMHYLYESIPRDIDLPERPRVITEFGDPADEIVRAATARGADLVVMGTRGAQDAIRRGRKTALRVTLRSPVPVLTVRRQSAAQSGPGSYLH